MHLGRPFTVRQRREELSHEWTLTQGDMSLIPAGWRTTVWSATTTNFLQVELCPELVRRRGRRRQRRRAALPVFVR